MAEKTKGSRKAPRTHQAHWKDSTITQRQQNRREKLNALAQAAGFASWSAFETACLNGTAQPTQRATDAPKSAPVCTCSMDDGIHEWNCVLESARR